MERTDGNATGGRKQREAYIITAQSDSAGSRLVIFNGQHGNLRLPVRSYQIYIRTAFHNAAGTVCQLMQNNRVRPRKLCLDRIFLEHQVIAVQFHVGIGVTRRKILLNLGHIIHQCIGRSKVYNQFTVCQRRIGYVTHQIITTGGTTDGSCDMGHFRTSFQIGFNLFQVTCDTGIICSFRQFIFHIKLIVHHIRKETLFHEPIAES